MSCPGRAATRIPGRKYRRGHNHAGRTNEEGWAIQTVITLAEDFFTIIREA